MIPWKIIPTPAPRSTLQTGGYLPSDDGLLGCTLADPATVFDQSFYQSGVPVATRCRVDGPASKLIYNISQAGAGLTAGENFLALYNLAGARVFQSPDMTAAFEAAGLAHVNLGSSLPAGTYYVVGLNNGATPPNFWGLTSTLTDLSLGNAAPSRVCYAAAGQTSLPANVNWANFGNTWTFTTLFAFA